MKLEIRELAWSFERGGEPYVVIDSLEVRSGAVVSLEGPSGSGKTSLLHLISGIETPSRGTVLWDGESLFERSMGKRDAFRRERMGLIFQDFQLIPQLDVWENVIIATRFSSFRCSAKLGERARFLMDRMGLKNPRQRVALLSRGEMQRVAVARALLLSPSVLLADEPTASLDAENEEVVSELLVRIAREEGVSLFVASHQPGIREHADIRIALDHGKIAVGAGAA